MAAASAYLNPMLWTTTVTFKTQPLAALVLGLAASAGPASATILFSDNFGTGSNSTALTALPNWNVTAGNVDLWNFFPLTHGRSLDLDGSEANATIDSISTFTFNPGTTYELSFSFGNNSHADNILNYSIGSIFDIALPASTNATGTPAFTTISHQFSVAATTSAKLRFVQTGPADYRGSIIDDVLLQASVPNGVPEPGSLALVGLALAGIGFSKKRKA